MSLADALSSPLSLSSGTLSSIRQLLDELEARRVSYCHWKGNHSIDAALAGRKDLDLLVDPNGASLIIGSLAATGFQRLVDSPQAHIPGIDHYLSLDPETAAFAHVHLHWQLIPTKGNPRHIRLPWETHVLSSRVRHERCGIPIPAPDLELLLFVVGRALRVRAGHLLRERLGTPFLDVAAVAEFGWLVNRVSRELFATRALDLLGARGATLAVRMLDTRPSAVDFDALKRAIAPQLELLAASGASALSASASNDHQTTGRTLGRGGRIIAFVGSDGAGKSTIVRATTDWLGAQIETRSVYLGAGDGTISLTRRALRIVDRLRRLLMLGKRPAERASSVAPARAGLAGTEYVAGVEPGVRALWKIMSKLSLAREKRARLAAAWRWRTNGRVVICDRYPQTQQLGFNDGPQLSPWLEHHSSLLRRAAQREFDAYRLAETLSPDLVIKLIVAPERAAERKHDMSLELLRTRGAAIRKLRFGASTRVVEIDAGRSLDVVLAETKRVIWQHL